MKNQGKWVQSVKEWGPRIGLIFLSAFWLMLVAASWAESAQAAAANGFGSDDDDYNFSWLDPDKKIYVLQNRKYRKEGHLYLSGLVGPSFNNGYRNTFNLEPRLGYFWNESWGLEVFYAYSMASTNALFDGLKNTGSSALPSIRTLTGELGLLLTWAPWYAKINVFNSIIYFDWYFQGGLGQLSTSVDTPNKNNGYALDNNAKETLLSAFVSTGQLFHVSQRFYVRTDFRMAIYSAPVSVGGASTLYTNLDIGLGAGVTF